MSFKSETEGKLKELYSERRVLQRNLKNLDARIREIETLAPEIAATVEDKEDPLVAMILGLTAAV